VAIAAAASRQARSCRELGSRQALGLLGLLANFGGVFLACRWLLLFVLLGQAFADGLEALLVEVLPELAVVIKESNSS
jgi:hypothetical protein